MKNNSSIEVEVKVKLKGSLAKIKARLRDEGFTVDKRRVFEVNLLFDTVDGALSGSGKALRIRRAGSVCTFTYKGPVEDGKHKSREEVETQVANFENLNRIVTSLGYVLVFRYEKYRTEYRKGKSRGVVTLDETPIGVYLEIEGPPQWIDRTATALGFPASDYVTVSYAQLYRENCGVRGIQPGNMTFE